MQQLIDDLRREHDDVRSALRVLNAIADRVEARGSFPAADCAKVLRYLRDFVVGVHFVKEAESLLRDVAVHGSDDEVELAGAVLRVQDDARTMLHSLVLFWEPCGELTEPERIGFIAAARGFDRLLQRGITLEEQRLFPAAHRVPGDDRLGWEDTCRKAEAGRTTIGEWRADLAALRSRWG